MGYDAPGQSPTDLVKAIISGQAPWAELEYEYEIVDALREVPSDAIVQVLHEERDPDTLRLLCDIAGYLQLEAAVHDLVKALDSEDEPVQEAAAEALWKIADPDSADGVVRALRDRLSDSRPWRLHNLVIAVEATQATAARPIIESLASSDDPMLAQLARKALGALE